MIICICEGISDREIRAAARKGVRSLTVLQEVCGAGGDCGQCRADLQRALKDDRSTQRSRGR